MNACLKLFDGAQKRIAEARELHGGLNHLSDWQVNSAQLVSSEINKSVLFSTGPTYIPMPTGTGKTTGAIWGIIEVCEKHPEQRVCFLTPYKDSVDSVYKQLEASLGSARVGRYHGDANVDKDEELKKQVVVLTHQFVPANKGRLDDRTLFIIDEAIYATGEVTLHLQDFQTARSWATANGIYNAEFIEMCNYVTELDKALLNGGSQHMAASTGESLPWAKVIASDLKLTEYAQCIDKMDLLSSVQLFCEALLKGLAFVSRGSLGPKRFDPIFSAAVMAIPDLKRTVVLTATGGLLYEITGAFSSASALNYWSQPSYANLRLFQLSGPKFKGRYKEWSGSEKKGEIIKYIDWLLRTVPETKLYLTMPKPVLENCLLKYFGQHKGNNVVYPIVFQKYGKTVFICHHSLSIGSNEFKDCEAVIYLWDHHIPKSVAIQRYHTLKGQPILEEHLANANGRKLSGDYRGIKEATYIDNMMQQIGRGHIRNFDHANLANPMSAYVLTDTGNRFNNLAKQYKDCQIEQLSYDGLAVKAPRSRQIRIVSYIKENANGKDIPASEVEKGVGFRMSALNYSLDDDKDLKQLGYAFTKGSKGRGKASVFRFIG